MKKGNNQPTHARIHFQPKQRLSSSVAGSKKTEMETLDLESNMKQKPK